MANKIYLSPSNQSGNTYATGNTNEMKQCNRIAEATETALKRCGFSVKRAPEGQNMYTSINESNNWGADLHIPIHTNAGGGSGTLVMVYATTTNNLKYANPIYKEVEAISPGEPGYGVQARTDLAELNSINATSVYVEVDFHDNASIAQWIINNPGKIGEAIAKGVCTGFGVKYVSPSGSQESSQKRVLDAAAQVFSALKTANPSFTYNSGLFLDFKCPDGTLITNVRQDCSGLMAAIIRYMGYTVENEWDWRGLTSNTSIKDSDGSYSKDWIFQNFKSSDRQPGDILVKPGHTDMYVFTSNGSRRGYNGGSGDAGDSIGTGMRYSYNLANDYLTNAGKITEATNIGAYTITDSEAETVLRYVGAGGSSQAQNLVTYILVPAKKIIFNPEPGLIESGTAVSVSTDAENAQVFVTLDNTFPNPEKSSQNWTGRRFLFKRNYHLRAAAFDQTGEVVAQGAATYTIPWVRPNKEPIDKIINTMRKHKEAGKQPYLMYHPKDDDTDVEEYVNNGEPKE